MRFRRSLWTLNASGNCQYYSIFIIVIMIPASVLLSYAPLTTNCTMEGEFRLGDPSKPTVSVFINHYFHFKMTKIYFVTDKQLKCVRTQHPIPGG